MPPLRPQAECREAPVADLEYTKPVLIVEASIGKEDSAPTLTNRHLVTNACG